MAFLLFEALRNTVSFNNQTHRSIPSSVMKVSEKSCLFVLQALVVLYWLVLRDDDCSLD